MENVNDAGGNRPDSVRPALVGFSDFGDTQGRFVPHQANTHKVDHEFIANVWSVMDEAGNLLIRKHHDYGPRNISQSPGGPLNGLRVRMWDKTARLNNLIDKGVDPQNESLKDTFIDLLNYSAIALLVLEGKWPNE